MKSKLICVLAAVYLLVSACSEPTTAPDYSGVQVTLKSADNGDGTYTNPIIQADYSDPDAIRVEDDFFMTASSFGCAPGLPILHSRDLVNWQLIAYASPKVMPEAHYNNIQHGNGIWAPSLRYHNGTFYIFYGDPDFGIFMLKSKKAEGPWSEPLLIKEAKGWIDSCPFWDEDGQAYLVHGYAGSRAGIKSILAVNRMKPDGTALLDDGILVFDGHDGNGTVEGPKFYKKNGYYYIFAPAGGVSTGWQLVLRSKNITGPYESKVVMSQGKTEINGPHQGAWVSLAGGEDWFLHFQDQEAYGRVVHLQPMNWKDNWPVIGHDANGDGTGEPVITYRKPAVKQVGVIFPESMDDEFNGEAPSLLWQWHANPGLDWGKSFPGKGVFRMYCQSSAEGSVNLWDVPSLFLQKWPAVSFEAVAKVKLSLLNDGERFGLIIMGQDYASVVVENKNGELVLNEITCLNARKGSEENYAGDFQPVSSDLFLKVKVEEGGICHFSYSENGLDYKSVGLPFTANTGRWIGSKIGFFAQRKNKINDSGFVDIDRFTMN